MSDFFFRTEGEAHEEGLQFMQHAQRELEFPDERYATEPFAPGIIAQRYHAQKPIRKIKTETDQRIYGALLSGPLALGYVSNPLLYSTRFRAIGKRQMGRVWGLLKGSVIRFAKTYPSQYWLIVWERR